MGTLLRLLDEPPPGDDDSCYVDSTLGVISILRSVASSGSRAAAYIDSGEKFMHTTLISVEQQPMSFLFEKGPDPRVNALALSAHKITLVTSDRGVPVQFSCPAPESIEVDGADAFRAALPERVLRLQRREYYRLGGKPVHTLVQCTLVRADDPTHTRLKPAVMDVSCGGLALALPATQPALLKGTRHACTVEIQALGRVDVQVEVHTSREVTLPTGAAAVRYGVEFLNMDGRFSTVLQRYIIEQERAKKARRPA